MKPLQLLLGLLIGSMLFTCSSDDSSTEETPNVNLKLIKKITITQNGAPQSVVSFEYANGQLISLTEALDLKTEYTYDGNQLDYERRLAYDFNTNSYNSEYDRTDFDYQNTVLQADLVTENGNPIQKHTYTLTGSGTMTRYDFFNYFNNQWNSGGSRLFEYASGNITEEIQTDTNDAVVFKNQYTYDDQKHPLTNVDMQIRRQLWGYRLQGMNENNILSYATYDMNGQLQSSYTYSYQYDGDGYPIEREKSDSGTGAIIETILYDYN